MVPILAGKEVLLIPTTRFNETVVVTGVSSFIGMHLACFLTDYFQRVVGTCGRELNQYDQLRTERLNQAIRRGVKLTSLDLTHPVEIDQFISAERPNIWIQHAGHAKDYTSPDYDMNLGHQVNVAPLGFIYSKLREVGCRGIIITGSCMEYSDTTDACREDDACLPSTAYGLSKLTETIRSCQLSMQYQIKSRIVRVFIPYGKWDASGKLINEVVSSLLQNKPIELSSCIQKRDFIHIDDLVRGYLACIEDLNRNSLYEIYNLCSGEATTVKEMLLNIAQVLEADPSLLQFGKRALRTGESLACYGSNIKASTYLNWKPQTRKEALRHFLKDS
ncbi:NAD-dependent epimerase/dehydratase family protein [Cohnella abietis]|uniref:UDP-glucose 4-epimerase n=1 Tax=Cohnella abietis TaxID=2507935 RepID=A0A3T1D7J2_9BACL|nr:NAD(P)-dependent oxidoreductase [Cohnella abietis]BBI34038.1 GDP-mannose 4,6-dehydratase [Cohnella abietis]